MDYFFPLTQNTLFLKSEEKERKNKNMQEKDPKIYFGYTNRIFFFAYFFFRFIVRVYACGKFGQELF